MTKTNNIKYWLLVFVSYFLISLQGFSQVLRPGDDGLQELRKETFDRLNQNVQPYSLSKDQKAEIAERFNVPLKLFLEDGKVAEFQYMDRENHPVYYTTHNVTAAITTGTRALQSGGGLGLNLAGQNMVIGIYDQTRPRANHNEFVGRVTQIDGSTETISNHATHVTGTILATGNNANARGMANAATGWAFNWDADISKMMQNAYDPDALPDGHLISNHSYGIVVGWFRDSNDNWAWAGNESISPNEDYRFGFYTNRARQIDELAFSRPYYTVVWAAGNDRNEVGDGSRDSDGPDDSIGPEGVAKNNIVVGAVNGITNYTGPNSVVMSSFSSWGPVDDGRVKPDLVAMGVNVFSSTITTEGGDSYGSLSGTSMAAPNVSGSLLLLQELYRERNAGRYMRSATLKALAIQTAKEAGMNPGPDYMFGWGVLDAEAAGQIIIDENSSSRIIRELVLENNQTYEFDFISDGIEPIKATIAWTDPAGTPPPPSLNPRDRMLVNDLDLRIFGEDGTEYFPWSLNFSQGANAVAVNSVDNNRDNVEQVVLNTPSAQQYTVRVSHKGNLSNNRQAFSLVLSAGVVDGQLNTLYYIGEDGNWDNPENWSLSSNGQPGGILPSEGTRVVVDRPISQGELRVPPATSVFSVNLFGNQPLNINLNNNNLTIESGLRSSNPNVSIRGGSITFASSNPSENVLDFGQLSLEEVSIAINEGRWRVLSLPDINDLRLENAQVELDMGTLSVGSLLLEGESAIRGRVNQIDFSQTISIAETSGMTEGFNFQFSGQEGNFSDQRRHALGTFNVVQGNLEVENIGNIAELTLRGGGISFRQPSLAIDRLKLANGVLLSLANGQNLTLVEQIEQLEEGSGTSTITADGKAIITHPPYRKYCFTNLNVENVDLVGESVVNLGPNAQISNAENWLNLNCENVLFPNFEVRFNCAGGLTEFINTSEGNISAYRWNFANIGTSTSQSPTYLFSNSRTYPITLEITGPGGTAVLERNIQVRQNTLTQPEIVANGAVLTSRVPASQYQWYRNGQPISEANSRSISAEEGGTYQVAVIDNECNRISAPVTISSLPSEPALSRQGYRIGPNPVSDKLNILVSNDYVGEITFEIFSTSGRQVKNVKVQKTTQDLNHELEVPFPKGVYVIMVSEGQKIFTFRIIKE
ncbi:S8 family serine peptidase [Pleomorphovibrio marinus]|uniref:S8 family serine peptidase n=1 Tax=Pleomorphovibrio marinus TaxID=2164132 RepID=UPI000E0C7F5A|nr:S8 family serine peptidase [Pleomorphovibrio marinus]